ncbi:probable ATP-dependent kinase Tda10p [[Candida] anglica]|uniref:Probable ATP-dependent kinase Tda10p n=1 Tax=[Candida] anglica TaxID=148631 RepID=A0ABP0EHE3_9ASCO
MSVLTASVEFVSRIVEMEAELAKPVILGVCGPQGSGKTYLSEHLDEEIRTRFPKLNCVKFSMDDLYLTHDEQAKLTEESEMTNNLLLQGRGLPGTHDVNLGIEILNKLKYWDGTPVDIPIYDKSAFSGEGDRTSSFQVSTRPDIIIFEGWFNGFQPLDEDQARVRYLTSKATQSCLQKHKLYDVLDVNETLQSYKKIWDMFDYFIYLDSDYKNVYKWRLEQEHDLIAKSGSGMTDEQVVKFIDRYIPVYELYYDDMCEKGCVTEGQNLRLVIGENRELLVVQIV